MHAWYSKPRVWLVVGLFLVVFLAVVVPLAVLFGGSGTLLTAVSVSGVRAHLQALQDIASATPGDTRGSLGPGFNASVDYVMQQLFAQGYGPYRQSFAFSFYQVLEPAVLRVGDVTVTADTARFSGVGWATGPLAFVGAGCEGDYERFPLAAGAVAVALDTPSSCLTAERVGAAVRRNATGLIIGFTNAQQFYGGHLAGPALAPIPVLRVSPLFADALRLAAAAAPVAFMSTNATVVQAYSANVIAETPNGDPDNVVVVGAHLDSVMAGPGINDNGSGSATILAVALELARLRLRPVNRVRFIWFGGEENGLLGSQYYVSQLQDQRLQLALMLNFDMLGSPNYMMGIYNGTNSTPPSGVIQRVLQSFADSRGIPHQPTPFTGRSDYGPFIALPPPSCPAGGIFTGAEVPKDAAEAALFGGMPNVPYDPCYHQACDTIENIDWHAISISSQIVAYAVQYFGFTPNIRAILGTER